MDLVDRRYPDPRQPSITGAVPGLEGSHVGTLPSRKPSAPLVTTCPSGSTATAANMFQR